MNAKHDILRALRNGATSPAEAARQLAEQGIGLRASSSPSSPTAPAVSAAPDEIAVIGMACRFPGAADLDSFWELLREGRDAVAEIPPDRWNTSDFFDPNPRAPGKTISKWGGCIPRYDHFDPAFFNLSPREAELMDPQQRQFLMVAWQAFEQAGYSDRDLALRRCGVYVGTGAGDYRNRLHLNGLDADAYAFMGNSDAILAGRISYFLNLRGPGVAIDTACSSSLVALHLACESLRRGEIELALAGGVTIQSTPQFHVMTSKAGMLSPRGRCRAFDEGADGFVPGEGVGLLLLKRLADAQRDRDPIQAVILGSGINQDGRTNGITAPSAPSQTALELEVYRRFAIDSDEIGYVEAHGTGTKLGDPIEVEALTEAFRQSSRRAGYCAIGSVKSNIGHALSAAGVAGVIKAILCLQHRELVPTPHFEKANPHIRFEGSPFRVSTRHEPWPAATSGRRLAAVSSFGFSGTNAHMVLREQAEPAQEKPRAQLNQGVLPFVFSAKSESALRAKLTDTAAWLRRHAETDLTDLAHTLLLGRSFFYLRTAFISSSPTDLAQQLEAAASSSNPFATKVKTELEPDQPALQLLDDWQRLALATDRAPGEPSCHELARSLANAFTRGVNLHWPDLFRLRPSRRLSLPVYRFDEAPFRAPESKPEPALTAAHRLHPLIGENVSTLSSQRYRTQLDPDQACFADHRAAGHRIFPAVAYLELALAAGALASEQTPLRLLELHLLRVLDLESRRLIQIECFPDGNRIGFEIASLEGPNSQAEPLLHATGLLDSQAVELPQIQSEALQLELLAKGGLSLGADDAYRGLRATGLQHGTAYQLLDSLIRTDDRVLARLRPASAAVGWRLNPFAADAAIQAALGLFSADSSTWLPGEIAEFILPQGDAGERGPAHWALVKLTAGNPSRDAELRLDASAFDQQGRPLFALKGIRLKRAPAHAPLSSGQSVAQPLHSGADQASDEPKRSDLQACKARLTADVLERVAQVLKVTPDQIDPDEELSDYGFDSIGFTELGGLLNDLLEVNLPPSIFFEHRTLASFIQFLLREQGPALERRYGAATSSASPASATATSAPTAPIQTPKTRARAHKRFREALSLDEPIAIIGMAGRLPGSADLEEFWQNLVQVRDLIQEVPSERWDWRAIDGDPKLRNKCNVRFGGFIRDVAAFDPLFFGISPREAEAMDPQQRLFLECAWHAIEAAGYRTSELAGRKVGVFAGVANMDYNELWRRRTGEIHAHAATGTAHSIVPNRVSFQFDLRGPSEPVDTACSSSLVAVYRAVAAIREGACELALAGGVNVMLTPTLHIAFNKAGMLNPAGKCLTFDKDAAGYVRGEGVGIVVLKPLSRALADGDTIQALVRGGALTHGGHASSLTAPNPTTQAELIVEAYRRTGIEPSRVGFIETHGTGTKLGDPAEIGGLVKAFQQLAREGEMALPAGGCALGAVKTNIGHLETAAGIAGLFKIILALRNQTLPGNAHFRELNPYIDLQPPFRILRGTEPWTRSPQDLPHIAGISSFGFGGALAHLVLEEADPQWNQIPATAEGLQLFCLSARSPQRLRALAESWVLFAHKPNPPDFASAAHTSRIGREAFSFRLALLATDWAQLRQTLRDFLEGRGGPHCFQGEAARETKLVLDGQEGADYLRALLQSRRFDRIAALWVTGAEIDWSLLAPHSARRVPLPLYPFERETYWPPLSSDSTESSPTHDPTQAPHPSAQLHPLILQNCSTLAQQLYAGFLRPDHPLLRDHRVQQRPILPGAAYLEWARAAGTLAAGAPVCRIAQLTWLRPLAPDQAGLSVKIELLAHQDSLAFEIRSQQKGGELLHAKGQLEWQAQDSTAPQLQPAREQLQQDWDAAACYRFFAQIGIDYGPGFRVIERAATGKELAWSSLALPEGLDDERMDWHPALLDGLFQTGALLLASQVQAIDKAQPAPTLLLPYALESLQLQGRLPQRLQVLALPVGPLTPHSAKLDFWLYDSQGKALGAARGLEVRSLPSQQTLQTQLPNQIGLPDHTELSIPTEHFNLSFEVHTAVRVWQRQPLLPVAPLPPALLFDSRGDLAQALAGVTSIRHLRRGPLFIVAPEAIQLDPADQGHWSSLETPELLILRLEPEADQLSQLLSALALLRAQGAKLARRRAALVFLYQAHDQGGQPTGIEGLARTAALEFPGLRVALIGTGPHPAKRLPALLSELAHLEVTPKHVRLEDHGQDRLLAEIHPALHERQEPDFKGLNILITGATGALAQHFARDLARRGARVLLSGRREPGEPERQLLAELGPESAYFSADLAQPEQIIRMIEAIARDVGELHGILHAAGRVEDALIAKKTPEQAQRVLAAKIDAVRNLDAWTRDQPLQWFALFGSLAGLMGNPGQADYAFANAWLADFAAWRSRLADEGMRQGRTLCLDWPYWQEGGMQLPAKILEMMEKQTGLIPLPTAAGLSLFPQALASQAIHSVITCKRAALQAPLTGPQPQPQSSSQPHPQPQSSSQPQPARPAPGLSDQASPPLQLAARLEEKLLTIASAILKIERQFFDPEDQMDAYGFDSINLTEFSSRLSSEFEIELLPSVFFEYPTLRAFTQYLIQDHGDKIRAKLQVPEPESRHEPQHEQAQQAPPAEQTPQSSQPPQPFSPRLRPTLRPSASSQALAPAPAPVNEPIAIVGISGAFPGAANLDEFWQRLQQGQDLVREIPPERWDWRQSYGDPSEGKSLVKRAGFMPRVDLFDAAFFGISPKEAALMDPQHRLILQAVWSAIEDAGQRPSSLAAQKVGVFIGVSSLDFQEIIRDSPEPVHPHELTGNAHSILTNRISYLLNLRGPSEPVDSACSSSLVAVHRAVRAIRSGEACAALVGGVNVLLSPHVQLAFAKAGMLSPDGRCKTFDKSADGYVRGEGVGAIFLKPLSAALADRNPIYALICGSAVNHGGRANSLVAPNPNAQAEVIVAAIQDAGIDPRTIGYIEAHGTGTALGDPIEINGLKKAFATLYQQAGLPQPTQPSCALSSVKTQIGHLEAAAGIAGLLKLVLSLGHRVQQGNIQLKEPNPYIRLEGSPFELLRESRPWPRPQLNGKDQPRRAGISSFGFGGVNAHLILEEYEAPAAEPAQRGAQIFPLSAKSAESLRLAARRLADFSKQGGIRAEDLAHTLQLGREPMPHRLAVVAEELDELGKRLEGWLAHESHPDVCAGLEGVGELPALLDEEEGQHFVSALLATGKQRKLAKLWASGISIEWPNMPTRNRVHAPVYPFAATPHWPKTRGTPLAKPIPTTGEQAALWESDAVQVLSRRLGEELGDELGKEPIKEPGQDPGHSPLEPASEADLDMRQDVASTVLFLRQRLAQIAGFEPEAISPDADLAELGLDSILAMDLLRDIESQYGLRLFPNELAQHRTLRQLAAYIQAERPPQPAASQPEPQLELVLQHQPPESPESLSEANEPPLLYLLSTPRAGSTLLRVMLMGHSRCFAPPELHLLPFTDMAERHARLAQEGKAFLGEGLVQTLATLQSLTPESAQAQVDEWIRQALPIPEVYNRLRAGLGQRFLVDKSPSYAEFPEILRRAEALRPAPRYIHLIRHPLAVADSFVRNRFHRLLGVEQEPWTHALQLWDRYNQNLQEFLAQIPSSRVFSLHYEDLVHEPEALMRRLCHWLQIPFEPALLQPYEGERLTAGLHSHSLSIGDPNFHKHESIDPTQSRLPLEHLDKLALLPPEAQQRAAQLGYDLSPAPLPLAPAQQQLLAQQQELPEICLYQQLLWPEDSAAAPLTHEALRLAWRRLLRKHQALRHQFQPTPTGWQQLPLADPPQVCLLAQPGQDTNVIQAQLRQSLRPSEGIQAACALQQDESGTRIHLLVHHLICDGLSLALLGKDLRGFLQADQGHQPGIERGYADYIARLQGPPDPAGLEVWRSQIARPFHLPSEGKQASGRGTQAAEKTRSLEIPYAQLAGYAESPTKTRQLRLLTALAQALAEWAGTTELLLAMRHHARTLPDGTSYPDAVGWFALDSPLAFQADANATLTRQNLEQALSRPLDPSSYARHSLTGQLPSLGELTDVRVNYQPASLTTAQLSQEAGQFQLLVEKTQAREYHLDLILREKAESIQILIRYNPKNHKTKRIEAFEKRWREQL